jgi:hypothetical protein
MDLDIMRAMDDSRWIALFIIFLAAMTVAMSAAVFFRRTSVKVQRPHHPVLRMQQRPAPLNPVR